MTLKDVDLAWLAKLTSQQIEHVTCLECCKYYIAPESAPCGHTLCHTCWTGRRACPSCAKPSERRNLRHNGPIQNLTEHVQVLSDAFEKLFNIKLDEFILDTAELECENDPTKNVKEWLASSQNHFSVPAQSSGQSSQETQHQSNTLNVTSNKIQIHTNTSKAKSIEKVVHVPLPQDDWDKIEQMPDTEDIEKDKENVIGPMDIEPFYIDDNEYTASNPRRSSRKRELKHSKINNNMNENSLDKPSSRDSSAENDKKSNKTKQNWNNVKRMRKEFSKLNKINKSKLNVSIERCKKTQSTANTNVLPKALSPQIYDIDENTPNDFNIEKQMMKGLSKEGNDDIKEDSLKLNSSECIENKKQIHERTQKISKADKQNNNKTNKNDSQTTNVETIHSSKHQEMNVDNTIEKTIKMPFYKRSALYPTNIETKNTETKNYHINPNMTVANDDIEITIKVGSTITNIFITKKNDLELKVNTDCEIQTSLGPHQLNDKNHVQSPQKTKTQNIVINVGDNHKIGGEHHSKKNPEIEELKKVAASVKSVSEKKNTDSADTATAQFEITESVEKELSKVMDCVEVDELPKPKKNPIVSEISEKSNKSQKPANQHNLEYLNDLDIFDNESIKELDVQLLKNTEHAPSEILLCTVKTKNKTQKHVDKRDRDSNDENALPKNKKPKLHNENSMAVNKTPEQKKSKQNSHESEPMTYDAIMGTVFATIDADIEEIRQSQNINKNTHHNMLNDDNNDHEQDSSNETLKRINKRTQETEILRTYEISSSKQQISEFCNQKYSENVFSVCVENEDDKTDKASTKEKMPINMVTQNVNEFLTPVMCQNLESTNEAVVVDNDVEIVNDDSDKNVIEETPQKTTSFSKIKQKNNQTNKETNNTQNIDQTEQRLLTDKKSSESENIKSVVNLTDSSEIKSGNEATVMEVVKKKSLETPLTINKFVDQIQHKSTPYARKSLNFHLNNVNDLDPEQTLCPTNDVIVKTTQEKEFMNKAFEQTPTTPTVRPLGTKNLELRNKKFKIAGSCLTLGNIEKLKLLCTQHKWTYTDKYSKDLTHLVVGVDGENKSQRSVKYMCALASSIWIISYEWVVKCLETNAIVNEEYFEVLDSTGEPGPMRSRIATKKLFQGIKFFCMEPFSVLDVDTLKGMLEAAGGRVVKEVVEVRVNDKTTAPALLLAEPENTQEDRFIYLAMELSIVPVNFEWVLNCLGSYTLGSIQELLLCPASLLPKAIENWPQELIEQEEA